jgi:hypothetical protein
MIAIPDELANFMFGQVTQKQMEMTWQQEQENSRAAARVERTPELKGMFDKNQPIFGVPAIKQLKLGIKKLDGEELYQALGANFGDWGTSFMRHIAIAQINSGFWWVSEYKVDCLAIHLEGEALRHFETQSPVWMRQWPFLEHVMEKMLNTYRNDLTMEQAVAIFQRPKEEVCHAAGGLPKLVLESIIMYASAELRPTLMAKANMKTKDWLLKAENFANFAQSMNLDERPARTLGRSINAVDDNSALAVDVTCNYCKKTYGRRVP